MANLSRTVVIFNPAAGRGRAKSLIDMAVQRLSGEVELRPTNGPGHAIELAESATNEGVGRVIAAGGDGTVHEVANGLLRTNRTNMVLSTLPLGSMNDYAHSLGLKTWWREPPPGSQLTVATVDIGIVRGGGRERFFVNGLGVGFGGMVTIESRSIRRLRGQALYTLAFLKAGWRHFRQPEMAVEFDGKTLFAPTLALSVNLAQREGGFPVTPDARLDDGWFDTFHAAGLKRWQLLRYLPALLAGSLPDDHPNLRRNRCRVVRLRSAVPLCVHTDGELFCVPSDEVRTLEIEIMPGRLLVETCPTHRPNLC
ncbi:MAG: diacylglycerol/lipid kinase family protein [Fimbriiglobus sp.]